MNPPGAMPPDTHESTSAKLVEDLKRVLAVSARMSAIHDTNALLDFIRNSAIALCQADRATLYLVDHKTHEVYTLISDLVMKEIRFPVGVGIAGHVAKTGETINIPDAYADPRFNKDVDKKTGYRTRNMLTMALKNFENKIIGVMQLLNKPDGPFTAYDEEVLQAMATNAACALETAQLLKHYEEKQKIQAALGLARDIQQGLLPQEPPVFEGYDIAGVSISADETGGDYFDHFPLGDGALAVFVGDVSGHGVGSALLMATARAYLKALTRHANDMRAVLGDVNTLLEQDSADEKFMTLFAGVIHPATHEFLYVSAGHDEPLYWHAAAGAFEELASTGMPLGIIGDMPYDSSAPAMFAPGDYLFMSTDGIWEAPNPANDRFGKDRLKAVLQASAHRPAIDMVNAVIAAVREFTGEAEQADDLTVLIIKRKPA